MLNDSKVVKNKYKEFVNLLLQRCDDIQKENERYVFRSNKVKRATRRINRDVRLLKERLDLYNDGWRTAPVVIPHPKRKIEQKRGPKPKIKNPDDPPKKQRKPRNPKVPKVPKEPKEPKQPKEKKPRKPRTKKVVLATNIFKQPPNVAPKIPVKPSLKTMPLKKEIPISSVRAPADLTPNQFAPTVSGANTNAPRFTVPPTRGVMHIIPRQNMTMPRPRPLPPTVIRHQQMLVMEPRQFLRPQQVRLMEPKQFVKPQRVFLGPRTQTRPRFQYH